MHLALLLFEHLRINRRAIKRFGKAGQRHFECHFAGELVLHTHAQIVALAHLIDDGLAHGAFSKATIGEANGIFACLALARIDRETDAGLQQKAERHQKAHNAVRIPLHVINGDRQNRLALIRHEIAGCVANLLLIAGVFAAHFQPIGL